MTFEVDLKATVKVQFSDEAKAVEYLIEGDWKEHFFEFADLSEIAEHLAYTFQKFGVDYLEGFGDFVKEYDQYVSHQPNEYGSIYIKLEEGLEVDYTMETTEDIV